MSIFRFRGFCLKTARKESSSPVQEYYLVALSQPRSERLAELQIDVNGKSLASKMVSFPLLYTCPPHLSCFFGLQS